MPIFVDVGGYTVNLAHIAYIAWDASDCDGQPRAKVVFVDGTWIKFPPADRDTLRQAMLTLGRHGTIHY